MCLMLCSAGGLTRCVEHFNVIESDVSIRAGLVETGLEDQLGTKHNT